jgi:hypothetical protein
MMQRLLHTRHFLACLLAAATVMALFFRAPFPEANLFLRVMALRSAAAFLFFKYSYTMFLYTTPYIGFSILLSSVYIFALKAGGTIRAGRLPLYPDPRTRTELSLVLGEVHHPRKQVPSETPRWLAPRNEGYSRESPSWGPSDREKPRAACILSPSRSWPIAPRTPTGGLAGSFWK